MALNLRESFRRNRVALTTAAAIAGASILGAFPAAAQQAFKCDDAVKIADAIVETYKGKISPDLIGSFIKFSKSNCDLATNFVRKKGTADEDAFGDFRVRLIALRKTATATPITLTK